MAFCPVLTKYYGAGTAGAFSTTTKLGGLVMAQTDNLDDATTLFAQKFDDVVAGRSMVNVFGSDCTAFS